jgi:hypothetical protein
VLGHLEDEENPLAVPQFLGSPLCSLLYGVSLFMSFCQVLSHTGDGEVVPVNAMKEYGGVEV